MVSFEAQPHPIAGPAGGRPAWDATAQPAPNGAGRLAPGSTGPLAPGSTGPLAHGNAASLAPGGARREVGFRAGVTTARLSELRPGPRPQRATSHVIVLVSTGQGTHTLDFVPYPCRPGTLIWGRPGQVHQFGRQPGLDATILTFAPAHLPPLPELTALRHLVDDPFAPTCWQPAGEDEEAIVADVAQIAVDCARYFAPRQADPPGSNRLGAALLAHELAVLLVRIAALAPPPPRGSAADVLADLRCELERAVRHRRVEDYAELLGCSVRTLTRACLAATGRSAKQMIDERVALEAKRLLATTDAPVADVGRALGFDEPTNFGRFFMREVGQAPGAFRAGVQAVPARPLPAQRSSLPGRLTPLSPDPGGPASAGPTSAGLAYGG